MAISPTLVFIFHAQHMPKPKNEVMEATKQKRGTVAHNVSNDDKKHGEGRGVGYRLDPTTRR